MKAEVIALNHHERWAGNGYPNGLSAEEIPLEARIVSICDVFDALTSKRPTESHGPQRRQWKKSNQKRKAV